jgi:hypothetical protein
MANAFSEVTGYAILLERNRVKEKIHRLGYLEQTFFLVICEVAHPQIQSPPKPTLRYGERRQPIVYFFSIAGQRAWRILSSFIILQPLCGLRPWNQRRRAQKLSE